MTSLFPYLEDAALSNGFATFEEQAKAAEFWETPPWAADAILRAELLTSNVWDPCCGAGIISEAAKRAGYAVVSGDLHDWGYAGIDTDQMGWSFLDFSMAPSGLHPGAFTVFMNPPFSMAVEFVNLALRLGARKVVCFQRFAWYESDERQPFWEATRPQRIYACADRATCWLGSVPAEERKGGTPATNAWFVWEHGQPAGPLTGHVRKKS